tara:strand:- start:99 stop:770 length:672 start_codon:yes stop_codon:yes gene_type:complete
MKLFNIKALVILLILGSCDVHYFNEPQPIDSKNIYTIPKKYRGIWIIDDLQAQKIEIEKNFYSIIENSQIIKELKTELDIDTSTYFIGNKIYHSDNNIPTRGFEYDIKNDSVVFEYLEINHIDFGQNIFLRKFTYGYLLNEKQKETESWWNIRFIDTRNNEGLIIREIGKEDIDKSDNISILHEDFHEYLVANLTKQDLQNFIDNGGFSDTLFFLKYSDKIKN